MGKASGPPPRLVGRDLLRERTNFFAVRLLQSTEPGREGESDRALLCHEERARVDLTGGRMCQIHSKQRGAEQGVTRGLEKFFGR